MNSFRSLLGLALAALLTQAAPLLAASWQKTVATDGTGDYTSVHEAILAAPTGSREEPSIIRIKKGVYVEKLYIQREKRFLRLLGEDASNTVLSYYLNANLLGENNKPIGTFRTPSTYVDADDFTAENLSFVNTAGPVGQALAIRIDGDRAVFRKCRFLGWQDTILTNRGRHYFENCYIEGHVDFIFGAATAYFERCEIKCMKDGYVTAASTPAEQAYGYVFNHCKITGADTKVRSYLGRPWRPFAKTIFLNTEMSEVIRPVGWHNWGKPEAEKNSTYGEFNSSGAGYDAKARVAWAKNPSAEEAAKLSPENVLAGEDKWNPLKQ